MVLEPRVPCPQHTTSGDRMPIWPVSGVKALATRLQGSCQASPPWGCCSSFVRTLAFESASGQLHRHGCIFLASRALTTGGTSAFGSSSRPGALLPHRAALGCVQQPSASVPRWDQGWAVTSARAQREPRTLLSGLRLRLLSEGSPPDGERRALGLPLPNFLPQSLCRCALPQPRPHAPVPTRVSELGGSFCARWTAGGRVPVCASGLFLCEDRGLRSHTLRASLYMRSVSFHLGGTQQATSPGLSVVFELLLGCPLPRTPCPALVWTQEFISFRPLAAPGV